MRFLNLLLIFFVVVSVYSCKSLSLGSDSSSNVIYHSQLDTAISKNLKYNTLYSKKAEVSLEANNFSSKKIHASFFIAKDSFVIISASLPLLGIDLARLKFSNEGLVLINRMDKTVSNYSFSFLNRKFGSKLDLSVVQSALTGDLDVDLNEHISDYKTDNDTIKISLNRGIYIFSYLINKHNYKVVKRDISNQSIGNQISILYSNYCSDKRLVFPYNITALSSFFKVKIDHKNVDLDGKHSINFSVPDSYKLLNYK